MVRPLLRLGLLALLGGGAAAEAGSIAGVCPDGSAFVVRRRADAPCSKAKFVSPSDLPPLRPELLPRPYTWYLDHNARDPNNPYNLLDAAEKIRAMQEHGPAPEPAQGPPSAPPESPTAGAPAVAPVPPAGFPPLRLGMDETEVRDLMRLVALRQQVAPASFAVEDIEGRQELLVRLAHSESFETRLLAALGLATGERRVFVFWARSLLDGEFHPNFLAVQGGVTFRPDPQNPRELGFIVGEAGMLEAGYLALGYLIVPARFDPAAEIEFWWDDRSLRATLRP